MVAPPKKDAGEYRFMKVMSDDKQGTKPLPTGTAPKLPSSRRGTKGAFSEIMREMKKVTWPTPKETNRLTGVVLAVCALMMILLLTFSKLADVVFELLTTGKVK